MCEDLRNQIQFVGFPYKTKHGAWADVIRNTVKAKNPVGDCYVDLFWHDVISFYEMPETEQAFVIFAGTMRTMNNRESSLISDDFNKTVEYYVNSFAQDSDMLQFRIVVIVKTSEGWRVVVFNDNLPKFIDDSLIHLLQNAERYDLINLPHYLTKESDNE